MGRAVALVRADADGPHQVRTELARRIRDRARWCRSWTAVAGQLRDDQPLTGRAVVDRIITDLAVIDVTDDVLVLRELAPGVTFEQVQQATEPPLTPGYRAGA